jgi:hypothetical protein
MAKAAKTNIPGTGLDLSREKIVQFSLIVKDRDKIAKRFSRVFGIPWKLYELNLGKFMRECYGP